MNTKQTAHSHFAGLAIAAALLAISLVFGTGASALAAPEAIHLKIHADHLLKQGHLARAISLYERVLKEDRSFANAYYNLATAHYLQGELEKAVLYLEVFVRLRPEDAEALYNLGCLKIRQGNFDEARKCFLRAEKCPCTRLLCRKIKEALQFTKDLQRQNPETQKLLAYVLGGLNPRLLAN